MMKKNVYFLAMVIFTGIVMVLVDFVALLFFGLPFSELLAKCTIPAILFLVVFSLFLGRQARCFAPTFFRNVEGEAYAKRIEMIGSAPIRLIFINIVLHALFLTSILFGPGHLEAAFGLRWHLFLITVSFGVMVGAIIYVLTDALVAKTLLDHNLTHYPRDLREKRQAAKAVIIPITAVFTAIVFTYGVSQLARERSLATLLIPLGAHLFFDTCMVILLKRNVLMVYSSVVDHLENLSSDQKDLTRRILVCSVDELGTITGMVNTLCGHLTDGIQTIKYKINGLTNTGFELSANMGKTSGAVQEISSHLDSMRDLMIKQENGANEAGKAVGDIKTIIDSLSRMIEEQTESVNVSSSAIEEMTANIHAVTQTLSENSKNVGALTEASENGRIGLHTVAQEIGEIARDSEGLLEINSLMNNIAAQTNLLSMNAAIEAAHAGDAGRGFAVVADEIRKLAESAGQQSKSTAAMLKSIKASIDNIIKSQNDVLARFEAIDSGVKTVSEHELNILSSMEEQETGGRQILDSIGRLKETTSLVKQGSTDMAESGGALVSETGKFIEISKKTVNGMNEILKGVNQIEVAINHVNDMSLENNRNFDDLKAETEKFLVFTGSEKKTLLVVDDDEIHLSLVKEVLRDVYEVITARSGKEALNLFFQGLVPRLILLDIVMPDMDGWDTFNRLRAISGLHDTPIAFFTGSNDPKDIARAQELGAVGYLKKPLDHEELLTRIAEILKKR